MDDSPKAPAGWYPGSSGGMRYWDGSAWTDYTSENYWDLRSSDDARQHRTAAKTLYTRWQAWLFAAVVAVAGLAALGQAEQPKIDTISATGTQSESRAPTHAPTHPPILPPSSTPSPRPSSTASSPKPSSKPVVVLLFMTDQKDGDSFVASDGHEYRLGLVNTPEASEQCGADASRFTRNFLSGGFTVDTYSTDVYGRSVAEVFNRSGQSLNVALAKSGFGNDRYLNQFRHENPDLARRLDAAFASAATPSCANTVPAPLVQQPKPQGGAGDSCMPGYDPCLPMRGDMNCPEVGHPVRVTGSDPYGLDRDGDGVGCD